MIGLYTGTRSGAILSLGWKPHADGGHVDLDCRIMYRRAAGAAETNKRRPPCRIEPRLMCHLRRWKQLPHGLYVVEWDGRHIDSVKRSWSRARAAAGLSDDVTPHTLRHTFVSWTLQRGVSIWDTAQRAGMSPQIVHSVYGHHAIDFGEDR